MYYEVHGRDDGAPTVVLSSGLGGAAHYWAAQIPAFAAKFRVIAYDQYGTGRSGGTIPDGYSIGDMAAELARLLDQLRVERCHLIGHALGGLIGLQLALNQPARLDRLVLVNAWAKTHPHTLRCFRVRKSLLLGSGPKAYVMAQPLFLYPASWLAHRQEWLAVQDAAGISLFPPADIVLRRIEAAEAFDLDPAGIIAPTLVIATRDDVLVPCTCSVALAEALPYGELVLLEQGGHACNVTDPIRFNSLTTRFLLGS
jgi:aminoacrylate hydrolase